MRHSLHALAVATVLSRPAEPVILGTGRNPSFHVPAFQPIPLDVVLPKPPHLQAPADLDRIARAEAKRARRAQKRSKA